MRISRLHRQQEGQRQQQQWQGNRDQMEFEQRRPDQQEARFNHVNTAPALPNEAAIQQMIERAVAKMVEGLQTKTTAGVRASKSTLMKIYGTILGNTIPMLVDSGADASLIKTATARSLGLEVQKGKNVMVLGGAFGEGPAEVAQGIAEATIVFPDGTECKHEFIIAKNCAFECIIGLDILDKMEAMAQFGEKRKLSLGGKAPITCEAVDATGYNHVSVRAVAPEPAGGDL